MTPRVVRDEGVRRARELGGALAVHNPDSRGEHWVFRFPGLFAEWWPSTGRLVFDKQWRRADKVRKFDAMMTEVELACAAVAETRAVAEAVDLAFEPSNPVSDFTRDRPAYLERLLELCG